MIVTHFQRRPFATSFSIERVFATVRRAFPPWVDCRVASCRHNGTKPLHLLYNMVEAFLRQAGINHITGDTAYLALLLPKRKTLITVHDCGSMARLKGWRRRLYRWCWLVLPVRRCVMVTAISDHTKQELIRYTGCPEAKIRVVPDPVGKEFCSLPREFCAEMPVILQIGAGANKNLSRVAVALRDLRCELHIVGRLRDEDRLQLDLNRVRYRVSYRLCEREIVEAYEKCDLVIFASTSEGFGMPIIEANAVGRPVVTSNIEPMTAVAGRAACFVDPSDPESIRRGILRIIGNPGYRQELVQHGLENIKRFSAETVAETYLAIYQDIAQSLGHSGA